jgi:two-component system KDP operon response regulator KdpE
MNFRALSVSSIKNRGLMAALKVLIADDNAALQRIVKRLLEREGYFVIQLPDTIGLVEQAAAAQPDVIVLDVGFPNADGRDLLSSLKRDARTEKIPVLVWSGQDPDSQRRIALALGAEDFIEKGSADELISKIERLLFRLREDGKRDAASAFSKTA